MNASSDPGICLVELCHPLGTRPIAAPQSQRLDVCCPFVRSVIFQNLCVSDPFAAVFGSESFGGGFADFSALAKVFHSVLRSSLISHIAELYPQ